LLIATASAGVAIEGYAQGSNCQTGLGGQVITTNGQCVVLPVPYFGVRLAGGGGE